MDSNNFFSTSENQVFFKELLLKLFNTSEEDVKNNPESFKSKIKEAFTDSQTFFEQAISDTPDENANANVRMDNFLKSLNEKKIFHSNTIHELPVVLKDLFGKEGWQQQIDELFNNTPDQSNSKIISSLFNKAANILNEDLDHVIDKKKIKSDLQSSLKEELKNIGFNR